MATRFVVHYSEVALKGNNRGDFVRALRRNINGSLAGVAHSTSYSQGRFIIDAEGDADEVSRRLSHVFGVSWSAPVSAAAQDYGEILAHVLESARVSPGRTFKIAARRSDKSFSLTSAELAGSLGSAVVQATSKKVDLTDPELTIHVDVVRGGAYVYADRTKGPGGLPVGTAGRAMHLFSGGIDSPVAAWLLMKRGTRPVYLHFYLAPTPQSAVDSKITRLVRILSSYGGKSTLVLLPFAEYQMATLGVPGELEPSLFRRFMRMTGEALAGRFGAAAISTGDSLSQAASQTLWNIAAIDQGCSLPVLRPLLTYDKEEIIGLARRIGTYDASIEEYKDCCAIITRHPRTRVKSSLLSEHVSQLGLAAIASRTIELATLVTYNPATSNLRVRPLADSVSRYAAALPSRDPLAG